MAKIDLENSLSFEELAALRDSATDKLAEKVAARQAELEAELEKLSHYGKPAKKSAAGPAVAKAKKSDELPRKSGRGQGNDRQGGLKAAAGTGAIGRSAGVAIQPAVL